MKLSFLTSCMNRLHHLDLTYLANIRNSIVLEYSKIDVEFVLLNYNSKDKIDDWVFANKKEFEKNVEFKYIKTTKPKFFDMSVVKNILGKNATGTHLCWLDADNLTETGFVDFVYSNFKLHPNCILNVPYSDDTKGLGGRIVCSKRHFLKVNGYDESFVGWGYEEIDFVNRLCKTGCKKISIPKKYLGKLDHSEDERVSNYDPKFVGKINPTHKNSHMKYKSNLSNFMRSTSNIKKNKLIANESIPWGVL